MTKNLTLPLSFLVSAALVAVLIAAFGWNVTSAAEAICPKVDESILSCKRTGMDYQMTTRPDGCTIAECIGIGMCPQFKDEARKCRLAGMDYEEGWDDRQCRRARCVPYASSEEGSCPMTWDEAQKKIKNCESEPGFKAITRDTGTCTVFVDCQRAQAEGDVLCHKKVENSCTLIRCDDGFTWNSCGNSSSAAVSSVAVSSSSKPRDPCAEIQLKAKETALALRADKRNPTLISLDRSLRVQLRQCRLKNAK